MPQGPKAPIFKGIPSPSLKKMRKMPLDQLEVHIRKLDEQAEVLRQKLERQKDTPHPPSPKRVRNAHRQLARLMDLAEFGRHLIDDRDYQPSSGYSRSHE